MDSYSKLQSRCAEEESIWNESAIQAPHRENNCRTAQFRWADQHFSDPSKATLSSPVRLLGSKSDCGVDNRA